MNADARADILVRRFAQASAMLTTHMYIRAGDGVG